MRRADLNYRTYHLQLTSFAFVHMYFNSIIKAYSGYIMSATTEKKNCKDAKTEVPVCWICHEETKEIESGTEALVRDCACRGTSGFAHWTCLVQYAANKVADGGDVTK